MKRLWDEQHGIYVEDARPENAPFDFFRFLAVCWLWLEIERLKLRINETSPGRWMVRSGWHDGLWDGTPPAGAPAPVRDPPVGR